jgi:hypothetical protein
MFSVLFSVAKHTTLGLHHSSAVADYSDDNAVDETVDRCLEGWFAEECLDEPPFGAVKRATRGFFGDF